MTMDNHPSLFLYDRDPPLFLYDRVPEMSPRHPRNKVKIKVVHVRPVRHAPRLPHTHATHKELVFDSQLDSNKLCQISSIPRYEVAGIT